MGSGNESITAVAVLRGLFAVPPNQSRCKRESSVVGTE
jgi:hypothetical protein